MDLDSGGGQKVNRGKDMDISLNGVSIFSFLVYLEAADRWCRKSS